MAALRVDAEVALAPLTAFTAPFAGVAFTVLVALALEAVFGGVTVSVLRNV